MAEVNLKKDINRNIKYEVEEILVLYELKVSPIPTSNVPKTFYGCTNAFGIDSKYNSFNKVVSKLEKKEMIRESTPRETLKYLKIPDLKIILRNISKPIFGIKNELINRINTYADDKDIANSLEKRYFVLTELGLEVLDKYTNVVWIAKNKHYIYKNSLNYNKKFNEKYFMKHWEIVDPIEDMIIYYKYKDSGIVARLYQLNNNLEQAFYYSIKDISETINFQVRICKEKGWFASDLKFEDFCIVDIRKIFNYLNITDESLDEILNYIYKYSIEDQSLITFDIYKEIIVTTLNREYELHNESVKKLCYMIREKFNHKFNNEVYSYDYNRKEEIEESLLEILYTVSPNGDFEAKIIELMDDLDYELIKKIKVKVDKRLSSK